uniref:Uncharacterized protein n=1 Tax=Timema genevievae TaxID=629358 RepID=A0A7R9JZC6_TIMGE|nr:unnamed protein product [Timema genevievae]
MESNPPHPLKNNRLGMRRGWRAAELSAIARAGRTTKLSPEFFRIVDNFLSLNLDEGKLFVFNHERLLVNRAGATPAGGASFMMTSALWGSQGSE